MRNQAAEEAAGRYVDPTARPTASDDDEDDEDDEQ